ncbi:unnamed protein product [Psylliodes chrysocephalus]|uniref:Uncharacterized protein n=1 Tax=Psylliodes chrysocephalus TaxID=3402493 RepID=A0A9P0GB19_9CUCU|nr:unnamed protein product [Psylliodes chrysocephala]
MDFFSNETSGESADKTEKEQKKEEMRTCEDKNDFETVISKNHRKRLNKQKRKEASHSKSQKETEVKRQITDEKTRQPDEPQQTIQTTTYKIPPIQLIFKSWTEVRTALKEQQIKTGKALFRNDEVAIWLTTSDDYKKTTAYLDTIGSKFYCNKLEEDKPYKVVKRGLPEHTPVNKLFEELTDFGLNLMKMEFNCSNYQQIPLP